MSKRTNQRRSTKIALSRNKVNLEGAANRDSMRAAQRNYGQGVSPDRGLKAEEVA